MEVNSGSENWVIFTFISVPLVAAAKDIPGFQGVFMPCGCLRKGEMFKVAAQILQIQMRCHQHNAFSKLEDSSLERVFKPEKDF